MSEQLFSADELREMGKRTLDRLIEAIDAGDPGAARKIAQRMYNEFLSMHDGYRNWITALLSEIGRRMGDDALEEIMLETVRTWWVPSLEAQAKAGDDRAARIKMFAAGLRGHLQPMDVEEDEEKVVLKMRPCGSGGRLILEGKYRGPDGFLEIARPQRMTYGRPDFPVYCAHEAAMEEIDIDRNGTPFVVVEPASKLGEEQCSFIIYKDPNSIPEKYYERLGRSKPSKG
jgi:hypothetical protein